MKKIPLRLHTQEDMQFISDWIAAAIEFDDPVIYQTNLEDEEMVIADNEGIGFDYAEEGSGEDKRLWLMDLLGYRNLL